MENMLSSLDLPTNTDAFQAASVLCMQQAEVDVSKSAQLLDNSAAIRKITTMHQVLCILNYSYVSV